MSVRILFGQRLLTHGTGECVTLDTVREWFPDVEDKTLRNRMGELCDWPEGFPLLRRTGGGRSGVYRIMAPEPVMQEAIWTGDDAYIRRLVGEKQEPTTIRQRRDRLREHAWPLIAHQRGVCYLCGRDRLDSPVDVDVDHIRPASEGFVLVGVVCTGCHRRKGKGTVTEARERLAALSVPIHPRAADKALNAAIAAGIEVPARWFEPDPKED